MKNAFLILFLWMTTLNISALPCVFGTIIDGADDQPLPSATVTLRRLTDSTLVATAISNADGVFLLEAVPNGAYMLTAGFIGYHSHISAIRLTGEADFQTGPLILQQESIAVGEALIVAERLRGKSEGQAITWFVNQRMGAASSTGLDLLQHIPGVQVDIMQNLSVQGNNRIILKVNGIVRDVAYLRQLNASRIERIEMNMTPGSGYDAAAGGVLNIVLKSPETGVGGHVYAELPLSSNEHYLFPNFSLNGVFGKWQLSTSYDAEISGFDIVERNRHTLPGADGRSSFTSRQLVRQDYQSHRFHYGADYTPNPRNQYSFYAYNNPFSNEHNGSVVLQSEPAGQSPNQWQGSKTDNDRNSRSFFSLFYKHSFVGGGELSLEASYNQLKGDNLTRYDHAKPSDAPSVIVAVKPFQKALQFKSDYQMNLPGKWHFQSGFSAERKEMEDRLSKTFRNAEQVMGVYGQVAGGVGALQASGGLRAEHWFTQKVDHAVDGAIGLFPQVSLQWTVNSRGQVALAYRRSVHRPKIYQLNPTSPQMPMHFSIAGNEDLRPVLRSQAQMDFSSTFGSNHLGFQLFYAHSIDVISPVSMVKQGLMESQYQNAGNQNQLGFQLTGGLNLFKRVSFSPYVKVVHNQNRGQMLANGQVTSQSGWAYDASLSTLVEINKTTVVALVVQYKSAVTTFQNKYFSGALYFVSVDKTVARNWKVGLKSALPFAGSFVYRGHEMAGEDFRFISCGTIYTSVVPLCLHVRYQFGMSGKVERLKGVEREERVGKGF